MVVIATLLTENLEKAWIKKMWTINKDFTEQPGVVGVSSADFDVSRSTSLKFRFRLLDDDRNVYYEGMSDDHNSELAFAPLDDFGSGYAGCVEIQYLENGSWETL